MSRSGLALLLALVACSAPPPSAAPARTEAAAPKPADEPAAPAARDDDGKDDGGFADPKLGEEPPPQPRPEPIDDPALTTRVQERFGERCRPERTCGELLGIDCGAAVDGPYYYVQKTDLKQISTCGGACMRGCTDCPPKAWTCPTY